jgi:hypothetical protein
MKQKKKKSEVTLAHTGDKSVVYDVDIDAGKFLVIYYTALDECEVYWKNGTVSLAAHTEEYRKAVQAVDKLYSKNSYGHY